MQRGHWFTKYAAKGGGRGEWVASMRAQYTSLHCNNYTILRVREEGYHKCFEILRAYLINAPICKSYLCKAATCKCGIVKYLKNHVFFPTFRNTLIYIFLARLCLKYAFPHLIKGHEVELRKYTGFILPIQKIRCVREWYEKDPSKGAFPSTKFCKHILLSAKCNTKTLFHTHWTTYV